MVICVAAPGTNVVGKVFDGHPQCPALWGVGAGEVSSWLRPWHTTPYLGVIIGCWGRGGLPGHLAGMA